MAGRTNRSYLSYHPGSLATYELNLPVRHATTLQPAGGRRVVPPPRGGDERCPGSRSVLGEESGRRTCQRGRHSPRWPKQTLEPNTPTNYWPLGGVRGFGPLTGSLELRQRHLPRHPPPAVASVRRIPARRSQEMSEDDGGCGRGGPSRQDQTDLLIASVVDLAFPSAASSRFWSEVAA
jgi:hypothetical protein